MSDTPTYDQLSALCAQMAAALNESRAVLAMCGADPDDSDGADETNAGIQKVRDAVATALTAYRTLSPDPQWQRVMDEKFVRAASIRFGEVYLRHRARVTKADLVNIESAMFSAMRHVSSRARGEG